MCLVSCRRVERLEDRVAQRSPPDLRPAWAQGLGNGLQDSLLIMPLWLLPMNFAKTFREIVYIFS